MVLFFLLIFLLLVLFFGGLYAYTEAFFAKAGKKNINMYFDKSQSYQAAKPEMKRLVEMLEDTPMEEIYIKSYDSKKLYGRYYHIKDGAPIQILMHGYKGNAKRDMCGGHYLAKKLEHNILLIDHRGCGNSQGRTITFGVKERRDALSWVNYLTERFGDVPILLVGVSMGGATVLMTADMDLPHNVVGIIADCPYSSPRDIIKKVCHDRHMPPFIYLFVTIGAFLFGGFNPNKESAVKSVKNACVPILILHGRQDRFVPYEMAEEIYSACTGYKELHCYENADHGMSYLSEPQRYESVTGEFIEKCLNNRLCVDKNRKGEL